MTKALKECELEGLGRIEISYYANSWEEQDQYFQDGFDQIIHYDLDQVQYALNSMQGLCHRVPMMTLLHSFCEMTKYK